LRGWKAIAASAARTFVKKSNFLKKEDVGAGALVTIAKVDKENVAAEGADPEYKVCLYFMEFNKPMVLNSTNGQAIAKITGHEDDIERTWAGARIVLYNDPNVSYGGKLMGGIRVRAPKQGAILPPPVQAPIAQSNNDDLPF
jgi:hypothetical protein